MMIVEHLVADVYGTHIGKHSGRLQVTRGGEKVLEAPLIHLQSVLIAGRGVSISADALEACCEQGIPVHFLDSLGNPYAAIYSAGLNGTIAARREQLRAYDDERAVQFATAITTAKIYNQSATLKYLAKNRRETAPEIYQELRLCAADVVDCAAQIAALAGDRIEDVRQQLMGIEGRASAIYWSAARWLIPGHYEWSGREGRGALDPINSLLNYGYGILYSQIERAVALAGLEPYAGFLHTDRSGKPSLVLDLIEEFRQIAVDRVVFGLAARDYTVGREEGGALDAETRRAFADKVLAHLEAQVRYEGKKFPLRHVIQTQARRLAAALREGTAYVAFHGDW
jgi:CRISPR-associated protein Cas1